MTVRSSLAPARILICDDESFIREAISVFLDSAGFKTIPVEDGQRALDAAEENEIDVAILDIDLPGMNGLEVLSRLKERQPDIEVVMSSGCGTMETAIRALRGGAYDYVTKPILDFEDELLRVVERAVERRRLVLRNRTLTTEFRIAHERLLRSHSRLASTAMLVEQKVELNAALMTCGEESELRLKIAEALQLCGASHAVVLTSDESSAFDVLLPFEDRPLEWLAAPDGVDLEAHSLGKNATTLEVAFGGQTVARLVVDRGRFDDAASRSLLAVLGCQLQRWGAPTNSGDDSTVSSPKNDALPDA